MQSRLYAFLFVAMLVPVASGEYGEERNGYPVNVDDEPVYPYIPRDLADRHPDLVADLLAGAHSDLLVVGHGDDGHDAHDGSADPLNKLNGYTLFPYYPLLTAEVQRMAEEHPGLVRLSSAGQSHAGLDLWLLEIADFHNPDRVPLADREVVYLDGGTHSNEYSGVYFVTEWLQFLLDGYDTNETAKWIVENRHVFVLPMVNPDGSNAMGRLNAITVNVNRNFPATWGTVAADQPPLNWGGPYPASEPETRSVIDVMQDVRPDFVQSTHCCGNLWLHPYGAEQLGHAPDFDMFTNICNHVFPDLTLDVERVRCGETWSTIYPAGGTTLDEGYAQTGASSWSYEMSGRGAVAPWGQPIVETDVREQEIESWRGVMHGMLHAEKYGALPRVTAVVGDAEHLDVTVTNEGWGNITQATLRFGAHAIALPALVPGQSVVLELDGGFQPGEVPVELEWKKRMHPDSNWGRSLFHVPLVADGGELVGELPAVAEAPSMGGLLPEPPTSFLANQTEPATIHQAVPLQEAPTNGVPAVGALLAAPLLALVAIALRRR